MQVGAPDASASGVPHENNAYLLLYERTAEPRDRRRQRALEPSTVPPSSTSWRESTTNNNAGAATTTTPPDTPKQQQQQQHLAGSGAAAAAAAASPAEVAASVIAGAVRSSDSTTLTRSHSSGKGIKRVSADVDEEGGSSDDVELPAVPHPAGRQAPVAVTGGRVKRGHSRGSTRPHLAMGSMDWSWSSEFGTK